MGSDKVKDKNDRSTPECHNISEAEIDETLKESFPASDPPSWTLGIVPCADSQQEEDAEKISDLTEGK